MKSMTMRQNGEWVKLYSSWYLASEEYTIEIVRKMAYHLRDNGKNRDEINEEVSKFVVPDPETQWGVSREFVNRLLDDVAPIPKEEQQLW